MLSNSDPAVEVLLATYNGERFLRDQIDSILAQTYQPLCVLARDDGSSDGTVAILEEYAQRFPDRFRLLPEHQPTGNVKWNFLLLMAASVEAGRAAYMACTDQDDVWLPDKVAKEMAVMQRLVAKHGEVVPLLVFSDLRVVDEALQTLRPSLWKSQNLTPDSVHRFARILAQNVVTGCTTLFNRALAQRMQGMPAEAAVHDWWMALLASAFGAAAALEEQTVLYRQHGANVLGAVLIPPPDGVPKWRQHNERRRGWEKAMWQAAAFLRLHGDEVSPEKRYVLEAFMRCETHPSRLVRAFTWLRHGLRVHGGLRPNLALLWYLWDMKAARQADPKERR